MYDLIIIGGGPAGVTAGIYAARQKLKTLLVTKSFGGQVARKAVAIENYPGFEEISGLELFGKFEMQLKKQEIEIRQAEAITVEKKNSGFLILTEEKESFESKAVIVTSGADPRPLEALGEKEFIGKGVSYCTTCDGPLFKNKTVAIIGGGNSGFEAAIFLSKIAQKIYILEYGSEVKADEANKKIVEGINKIEVLTSAALKKIQGSNFVESIVYQDRKTDKEVTLPTEGVFVEIGYIPATSFVKDLVDFNEKDEIVVDFKTSQTRTPGLFAAGDVTDVKDKQIVIAAGQGATAALSCYQYLRKTNNF
ncbi:MAG: FAD-dependent oxidoreductase [bacterium]|nr:FAD-dependent oxidoreductase [bacterium]